LPGIAGIVDLEGRFDLEEKTDGMLTLMKHEPWYKVGRFCRRPMSLGKASPGIVDPISQPVSNQDGSLCLVMYGKVYSYPDELGRTLKKTPLSAPDNHPLAILNLIETHGIEIVKGLNGSFVLAMWDSKKSTLTIANDRFGLRPLYYSWQNRLFIFASEMKSLLTFSEVEREIDLEGMTEFFSFDFIMQDRTLVKHIKRLDPASILVFQNGDLKKESYWTLNLKEDGKGFDQGDSLNRAHFLVKQAVKRQIEGDIPKTLSLSGGLDSRTLLGAAAQLGYKIPTFTFGVPGCADQKLAKAVSETLGMQNRFFELSPDFLETWAEQGVWLTEGMNNCVNFHGIEHIPEIRKTASVVLNGFLGGELFGFLSLRNAQLLFRRNSKHWIPRLFRRINSPFPESELARLFRKEYYVHVEDFAFRSFVKLMEGYPSDSPFNRFYRFRFSEQAPRSFLYGLLLDNNLVEYRAPFCDYDLVDFVSTIPPAQKNLAIFHRRLLTDKFPPLGAIPYQRTGLPVSASVSRILFRKTKEHLKKKIFPSRADEGRYSDYDTWMRGPLKSFLTSILLSERFLSQRHFNPDYVREMVEQHLSGKQNLSSQLGALVTFELWSQLFLDQVKNPQAGCV
jgi:asparagine synthase (glutamine-hydrolysing)